LIGPPLQKYQRFVIFRKGGDKIAKVLIAIFGQVSQFFLFFVDQRFKTIMYYDFRLFICHNFYSKKVFNYLLARNTSFKKDRY
jgi:hypothetical protein